MFRRIGWHALLLMTLGCIPLGAQAAIINMTATLGGDQEVPPNASTGTGSAAVTFDDVSNLLSWDIVFSGLTGPATAAHFHGPAGPGETAGPQVDIAPISGLGSPMVGSATINDAQESQLLSGLWYINIHTSTYPDGEIRGQVLQEQAVIPLPAAGWLMFSGLAGLWSLSRRR